MTTPLDPKDVTDPLKTYPEEEAFDPLTEDNPEDRSTPEPIEIPEGFKDETAAPADAGAALSLAEQDVLDIAKRYGATKLAQPGQTLPVPDLYCIMLEGVQPGGLHGMTDHHLSDNALRKKAERDQTGKSGWKVIYAHRCLELEICHLWAYAWAHGWRPTVFSEAVHRHLKIPPGGFPFIEEVERMERLLLRAGRRIGEDYDGNQVEDDGNPTKANPIYESKVDPRD